MVKIEIVVNNTNFAIEVDDIKDAIMFIENCTKDQNLKSIKLLFEDSR